MLVCSITTIVKQPESGDSVFRTMRGQRFVLFRDESLFLESRAQCLLQVGRPLSLGIKSVTMLHNAMENRLERELNQALGLREL
jgi:hypothetical protein